VAMGASANIPLILQTNATEKMRIDSSGNVCIGRTSPSGAVERLSIGGQGLMVVDPANNVNTILGSYGGTTGIIGTFSNHQLEIRTDNTERMRIDSSGNVAIGVGTDGNSRLLVYGTTNTKVTALHDASTGQSFFSVGYAAAGTGWHHFNGVSGNNTVQNILIYGNGNIQNANNSYGALSDIKLKENIVDATPKLEKLLQVRVRSYNLKGDYEQHKQLGVVAQELEQIFPSLVEETADKDAEGKELGTTTKGVKYSVFVPMLIKAIQELNAKLDAQAARIAALESK